MESYERLIADVLAADAGTPQADESFGRLVEQFERAAFEWAYAVVGDPVVAQDVVQEAFLAAYRHLDQLREPRAFPGWLRRIVLSQCNRLTRRYHPPTGPFDESGVAVADGDPASDVEDRELKDNLRRAIEALPDHERDVTELFYLAGLSQREVAEALDLPLTTVKKRLQYAREHLKEAMPEGPVSALWLGDGDDLDWQAAGAIPVPAGLFPVPEPEDAWPVRLPLGMAVVYGEMERQR